MTKPVTGRAATSREVAARPQQATHVRWESFDMNFLKRAGLWFDKIIDALLIASGLIVFIQALWVSQDVIVRKIFGWTWAPSFEILAYSLVWMTFLGTTAIYRDRGHVVMEAIVQRFPVRMQNVMSIITTVAVAGLCLFMLFFTARLTVQDYQNHFILSSILNPPKWPIELVIPLSFLLLFIQALRHVGFYYRAFQRGERVAAGEQTSL
jgi:TRAP-type C4-dicarboxylate transport system permease small subunit